MFVRVLEEGERLTVGRSLGRVLAEGTDGTALVRRGRGEVTREAVEETRAVLVGRSATLGEATLALAVDTETVVAVRVGRAGSAGDTAEVGARLELLGALGVDGGDAVTLVAGRVVVGTGVDEEVVGALRLVWRRVC